MATNLIAPKLGEGVEELTIVSWLKNVGDQVAELESVVEIETDKVVTEYPSPVSGTLLSIEVPQGSTVGVGGVMGIIGDPNEKAQPKAAVEEKQVEEIQPAQQQKPLEPEKEIAASNDLGEERSNFVSPLVRKMAAEHNLDIAQIQGTGLDGRVTKADVEAFLKQPAPKPQTKQPDFSSTPTQGMQFSTNEISGQLIPHTSSRKQIAERMVQSKHTSPHVLTVMEADMSRVLAHRKVNKPIFARDGVNLTLTAYFIAAMVEALKLFPRINASWTDEGLLLHKDIHIGMAVALGEAGLIVPVIHQAQNLSLQGIAQQVNELSERARSKRLKPEEVKGGTFTLTNHGTGGSLFAMPVINQPQLGILGTGVMQKRPVVITDQDGNDSIAIRPMVYLSLVFDHRSIDGEAADNFLLKVKQILENWS